MKLFSTSKTGVSEDVLRNNTDNCIHYSGWWGKHAGNSVLKLISLWINNHLARSQRGNLTKKRYRITHNIGCLFCKKKGRRDTIAYCQCVSSLCNSEQCNSEEASVPFYISICMPITFLLKLVWIWIYFQDSSHLIATRICECRRVKYSLFV